MIFVNFLAKNQVRPLFAGRDYRVIGRIAQSVGELLVASGISIPDIPKLGKPHNQQQAAAHSYALFA